MPPIVVNNLCKSYDGTPAVIDVSFEVEAGETFALLGPNGAGKTTTIEILEGYRRRDSGEVKVLGFDPVTQRDKLLRKLGLVLQSTALEPELTVMETLRAFARLHEAPLAIDGLVSLVGLGPMTSKRVQRLSGGQQRRLEIAVGLLGDPDVIVLDEPTTGLDPDARRKIWRLVGDLNGSGKTILMSSHYMDEVEALAHRVAIMVEGRILIEGAPDTLRREVSNVVRIRFRCPVGAEGDSLPAGYPEALRGQTSLSAGWVVVDTERPTSALSELAAWRAAIGDGELPDLTVTQPALEDIYLTLTQPNGNGRTMGDRGETACS